MKVIERPLSHQELSVPRHTLQMRKGLPRPVNRNIYLQRAAHQNGAAKGKRVTAPWQWVICPVVEVIPILVNTSKLFPGLLKSSQLSTRENASLRETILFNSGSQSFTESPLPRIDFHLSTELGIHSTWVQPYPEQRQTQAFFCIFSNSQLQIFCFEFDSSVFNVQKEAGYQFSHGFTTF